VAACDRAAPSPGAAARPETTRPAAREKPRRTWERGTAGPEQRRGRRGYRAPHPGQPPTGPPQRTQSSDVTPHEPHRPARGPPAALPQRTQRPAASAAHASQMKGAPRRRRRSQQTQSLRPREQAGHRKAGAGMGASVPSGGGRRHAPFGRGRTADLTGLTPGGYPAYEGRVNHAKALLDHEPQL
jgi:hypothetical protein